MHAYRKQLDEIQFCAIGIKFKLCNHQSHRLLKTLGAFPPSPRGRGLG
jgi:hypothetical protein